MCDGARCTAGRERRAVDDRTCEVRRVPGLYVVGEALDVDAGVQWLQPAQAWASGLLAGWSAAERIAGLASLADFFRSSSTLGTAGGRRAQTALKCRARHGSSGGNLCTSMNCADPPPPLQACSSEQEGACMIQASNVPVSLDALLPENKDRSSAEEIARTLRLRQALSLSEAAEAVDRCAEEVERAWRRDRGC